jgi:hypothetical protein
MALDQSVRGIDCGDAVMRVNWCKGDYKVGVCTCKIGDVSARDRGMTGRGVRIDREDDGRHASRAVALGKVLDGRRALLGTFEERRCGLQQLVIECSVSICPLLDVDLNLDRCHDFEVD